jgi:hypothetical protein
MLFVKSYNSYQVQSQTRNGALLPNRWDFASDRSQANARVIVPLSRPRYQQKAITYPEVLPSNCRSPPSKTDPDTPNPTVLKAENPAAQRGLTTR